MRVMTSAWRCVQAGSVATAEDPTAIANIQSATTFSDQPIKYLFKTEGAGGQVIPLAIQRNVEEKRRKLLFHISERK